MCMPVYIEPQGGCPVFFLSRLFLETGSVILKLMDSDILVTQHASGISCLLQGWALPFSALYVGFRVMSSVLPDYTADTLLTEPSPQLRHLTFVWGSDVNLNCIVDSEIISSGLLSDRCSS